MDESQFMILRELSFQKGVLKAEKGSINGHLKISLYHGEPDPFELNGH